jgi:hypothetical protein
MSNAASLGLVPLRWKIQKSSEQFLNKIVKLRNDINRARILPKLHTRVRFPSPAPAI